ncbi:helix-turn-helix domain-containing protein [Candidatus Woesearchaeota archaeon]|nr:helix-turn-helix domain-containing protein [Candidatus Woesearchaeota archaeon]
MRRVAFVFLLLLLPVARAEQYFADVTISVDGTGSARIRGISNHPLLAERTTQDFTSKRGSHWLLNISINESFSEYVYSVELPSGAEINYIKSAGQIRIGNSGEHTFVKGTGKGQVLAVAVEYSIADGIRSVPVAAGIAVLLAAAGIVWLAFRIASSRRRPLPWYRKQLLPPRQLQIVELLERAGKPLTQKQVEADVKIPKSSVSRNLESMARSGIISKETHGMTNVVYLNQSPPDKAFRNL